eukprot:3705698-Rhodomonas_salina.2
MLVSPVVHGWQFVSKKIRDFVGVASRQSVIDSSVQIPEIDGLPLHLGLLRLTGDKLYPDTALVFRAMLLVLIYHIPSYDLALTLRTWR